MKLITRVPFFFIIVTQKLQKLDLQKREKKKMKKLQASKMGFLTLVFMQKSKNYVDPAKTYQ